MPDSQTVENERMGIDEFHTIENMNGQLDEVFPIYGDRYEVYQNQIYQEFGYHIETNNVCHDGQTTDQR